jgi:hypothetical protein
MISIKNLTELLEKIPHKNDMRKKVMLAIPYWLWPQEGLIRFFENLGQEWREIGKMAIDNAGRVFPPIALGTQEYIISQAVLLHLKII